MRCSKGTARFGAVWCVVWRQLPRVVCFLAVRCGAVCGVEYCGVVRCGACSVVVVGCGMWGV